MMVPVVGDVVKFLVVFLGPGLGAHQDHLHAQEPEGLDQGEGLEGPAHVNGGLFAGQGLLVFPELAGRGPTVPPGPTPWCVPSSPGH